VGQWEPADVTAETWIAIAAALIAATALYFNGLATRAALRAAKAAEHQTAIQQQLRIDAAQPYVWVDVRPDDATGTLLNLIVGNSGPTVATGVRVQIDPPLPSIDQLKPRASAAQNRLDEGLASLAPGRTLVWPLGQGFNLLKDDVRQVHTLTVSCDGPFGRVPPVAYDVDLSEWRGVLDRPRGSLHQLTAAVKDLNKTLDRQD
jgi:hypothetical protein